MENRCNVSGLQQYSIHWHHYLSLNSLEKPTNPPQFFVLQHAVALGINRAYEILAQFTTIEFICFTMVDLYGFRVRDRVKDRTG